jgi:replicative DNA helicase Mcm
MKKSKQSSLIKQTHEEVPEDDNKKQDYGLEITEEDKMKIKRLSKNPEIFNLIINSIAPYIHGHNDIKEAIAFQLFGGVTKEIDGGINIPGGINVLIVGDPGIGKTHLLKGSLNLALKGFYIDSNKSYVNSTYNHLSDEYDLQNLDETIFNQENYLVCIDSLKVKPDEVMFLREAMGKNTSFNTNEELLNILNSKCSVLAATNPKFGRFDRYKSIFEQINLPSNILSCFDMIFLAEDRNRVEKDSKLAFHLLKLHQESKISFEIDHILLKKYIAYARDEIKPKLSDEAIAMIHEFYLRVRQLLDDETLLFPITARQLESLIKLSEACARIRLSDKVTADDVKRVINIYEKLLKLMGFDLGQRIISSDTQLVIEVIKDIEKRFDGQAPIKVFMNEISTRYNLDQENVKNIIKTIKSMGLIYEPQKGFLKSI